jgi:peptidoglycan/xylan/chitin deacetylase (PgdA/CDA1 family)
MLLKFFLKNKILQLGTLLYANHDSKIIYYHDIHNDNIYTDMSTDISLLKKHINKIKSEGYEIVSEIKNLNREVQITFDDGFRGIYENLSFFVDNKIPFTIFLISDFLNRENYLTTGEVKEMLESGLLTIGSHTCSHRNLDSLSVEDIKRELGVSKNKLENIFNIKINMLCYPRGKFNDNIIKIAEETGYSRQYSCLPKPFSKPFVKGVFGRSLVQDALIKEFSYILKGGDMIFYKRYLHQQYNRVDSK